MRGFEQRIIHIIKNDNVLPSSFPDRNTVRWDTCAYISNSALNEDGNPITIGDSFPLNYLDYAPSENPKLYAHIEITPGTNGSYSNTGNVPGAPNNIEGSSILIDATIRFGPESTDPIFPISASWIFTVPSKSGKSEVMVGATFVDGVASLTLPTYKKPFGEFYIDESLFELIYITNEQLTALGQNLDADGNEIPDGSWQVVLVGRSQFYIYEKL